MMTLDSLSEYLSDKTGVPFAVFSWSAMPSTDFGTVGLTGPDDTVYCDGELEHMSAEGYVDLCMASDGTAMMSIVNDALNDLEEIAASVDNIWYDKDVHRTHYVWRIGMVIQ